MRRLHDIPQEIQPLKEYRFTASFAMTGIQGAIDRLNRAYQDVQTQVNIVAERFIELRATGFR